MMATKSKPAAAVSAGMAIATAMNPTPINVKDLVNATPDFIDRFHRDYRSKVAHTFIIHGNTSDYMDNTGTRCDIRFSLSQALDSNCQAALAAQAKQKIQQLGRPRVLAFYSVDEGLEFAHPASRQAWDGMMEAGYDKEIKGDTPLAGLWDQYKLNRQGVRPLDRNEVLQLLNAWFRLSRMVMDANALAKRQGQPEKPEVTFTVAFFDADLMWPAKSVSDDRTAIGYLRSWARNTTIGERNRIILTTRHQMDIEDSVRGSDAGVSSILIKKPNLEERQAWLRSFDKRLEERSANNVPLIINDRPLSHIRLAEGFDLKGFAIQAAGLSRRQMETCIMTAEVRDQVVDEIVVREIKQEAITRESGGMIEFKEPTHGFDQIGGHEGIKMYFRRKAIEKLRKGDRKGCTPGALLVGPPGTAKTQIATALAFESKMNLIIANFSNMFGGHVGDTEKNTKLFFELVEAAAPCIVFGDEFESAMGSGRVSHGDSNTAGRQFNSVMTWLSDPSRLGRIVFVGATNRPEMLDPALIRKGRFGAILPALPPAPGNVEGRAEILMALHVKHGIRFAKELQATMDSKERGLGRLLHDTRVWTGAEIEAVLLDAFDNADVDKREVVSLDDFERSFDDLPPNTREVSAQIDLALSYSDRKYVPAEWRSRLDNSETLRERALQVLNYGELREETYSRD